jgi:peptidyl-prolyl cis-trans isomerase SurA
VTRRALLVLILFAGASSPAPATEQLVDGIAAQVGGEVVLISEVMTLIEPAEKRMRAAGAPAMEIAKLRANGLEQMIERRLIERVVRERELYATDEELDEAIGAIAAENNISLDQVEASVEAHGLDYDDYREEMKRQIEQQKVVSMIVGSSVRIEEVEVQKIYDERFAEQPAGGAVVHLRQILVTHGRQAGRTQEDACQIVTEARARIDAGESFSEVAAEVSEVAPTRGGDIGAVHEDTVAPWMAKMLSKMESGQISEVEALPFGCTMLEVVERREYTPVTFEIARPRLEQELFEQKLEKEYREWVEQLREHTYIERKGHFADATILSTSVETTSNDP